MDYSREWWVRLYARETNNDRAKPVLCRGLRDNLLRYAEPLGRNGQATPRSGELMRGKSPEHVIEQLVNSMGAHPDERDLVVAYIETWIDDGWLTMRKQKRWHNLCITNYVAAQTARTKAAERQRRYRERQARSAKPKGNQTVTRDVPRDATETPHVDNTGVNGGVRERERERERERDLILEGGPVTANVTSDAEDDFDDRHEQVCELAAEYLNDPFGVGSDHGQPHTWPPVVQVIEAGNRVWARKDEPRNSGDRRILVIVERLSDGITVPELIEAIEGSKHDEFTAANPKLQSVASLLKHPDRIETFRQLAQHPPEPKPPGGRPARGAPQQREGSYETGWTEQLQPPEGPEAKAAAT